MAKGEARSIYALLCLVVFDHKQRRSPAFEQTSCGAPVPRETGELFIRPLDFQRFGKLVLFEEFPGPGSDLFDELLEAGFHESVIVFPVFDTLVEEVPDAFLLSLDEGVPKLECCDGIRKDPAKSFVSIRYARISPSGSHKLSCSSPSSRTSRHRELRVSAWGVSFTRCRVPRAVLDVLHWFHLSYPTFEMKYLLLSTFDVVGGGRRNFG